MGIRSGIRRSFAGARRASRDQRGGVAPMFAVIAGLLVTVSGVGLDISRVTGARSQLQDATDAAGLALGRMPPQSDLNTVLTPAADAWVKANLHGGVINPANVTVTVDPPALGVVTIHATTAVQPTLAAMVHLGPFQVSSRSTIKYGLSHVELSLVLDNTGSMAADNKLKNLKTAAISLIKTLSDSAAATGDDQAFKAAIVPFSMAVNIGTSDAQGAYRGRSWLVSTLPANGYGPDNTSPNLDRFAAFDALQTAWGGCVESRPMPYDIQEDAPTVANPATLFVPYFAPDEPDAGKAAKTLNGNGTVKTAYPVYNDYIGDNLANSVTDFNTRQANKSKYFTGAKPSGSNGYWGGAAGPNAGCGVAPITRLAVTTPSNRQALIDKINAMVATGDTEIPLGMMWGWHTLSPNLPFADGQPYGTKNLLKVVVLVTDGDNTYSNASGNPNASFYTSYGYAQQTRIQPNAGGTTSPAALNDRLAKLCANMKSGGNIVIYTVPVEVSSTSTKAMLQTCASSPDKYIDVTSSGLQNAFNAIAGSIGNLRISQ